MAEARLLALVDDLDADVVVLARYMQVLSDEACAALKGRATNIHHSFLLGFKGAEALALSRAVRWHCENRVLLHGHRTVVFS